MARLYSSEELTTVDRQTAINRLREQAAAAKEQEGRLTDKRKRTTFYNISAYSEQTANKLSRGSGALTYEERMAIVRARYPDEKTSSLKRKAALPGTSEKTRAVAAQREIALAKEEYGSVQAAVQAKNEARERAKWYRQNQRDFFVAGGRSRNASQEQVITARQKLLSTGQASLTTPDGRLVGVTNNVAYAVAEPVEYTTTYREDYSGSPYKQEYKTYLGSEGKRLNEGRPKEADTFTISGFTFKTVTRQEQRPFFQLRANAKPAKNSLYTGGTGVISADTGLVGFAKRNRVVRFARDINRGAYSGLTLQDQSQQAGESTTFKAAQAVGNVAAIGLGSAAFGSFRAAKVPAATAGVLRNIGGFELIKYGVMASERRYYGQTTSSITPKQLQYVQSRAIQEGKFQYSEGNGLVTRSINLGKTFANYLGPGISYFPGNSERYNAAVNNQLSSYNLSPEETKNIKQSLFFTRASRAFTYPAQLLYISTQSELFGQAGTARTFDATKGVTYEKSLSRRFVQSAQGIAPAGFYEGYATVSLDRTYSGQRYSLPANLQGGVFGAVSAGTIGGFIGATANRAPKTSKTTNVAAYTIDIYEFPGDFIADKLTKRGFVRGRVPVTTITPTTESFGSVTTTEAQSLSSSTNTLTTSRSRTAVRVPTINPTPTTSTTSIFSPNPSIVVTPSPSSTFTPVSSLTSIFSPTPTPSTVFSPTPTIATVFSPTTTTTPTPTPTTVTSPTPTPIGGRGFPFLLPFGEGGPKNTFRYKKGNAFSGRKYGYTPSFAALELGITSSRAPRTPTGGFTGLELRPVITSKRTKGKKRRKKK